MCTVVVCQADNRILDEALAIIGEAIKLDNEEKYAEALTKYMLGVERIIHVIRCMLIETLWWKGEQLSSLAREDGIVPISSFRTLSPHSLTARGR